MKNNTKSKGRNSSIKLLSVKPGHLSSFLGRRIEGFILGDATMNCDWRVEK